MGCSLQGAKELDTTEATQPVRTYLVLRFSCSQTCVRNCKGLGCLCYFYANKLICLQFYKSWWQKTQDSGVRNRSLLYLKHSRSMSFNFMAVTIVHQIPKGQLAHRARRMLYTKCCALWLRNFELRKSCSFIRVCQKICPNIDPGENIIMVVVQLLTHV